MRNVKIIAFKTVLLIELLPAVHCRHAKCTAKCFLLPWAKLISGGDTKYVCVDFSFDDQSLQCIFKLMETKHVIFF